MDWFKDIWSFFNSDNWSVLGNVLMLIGIIAPVFTIPRFIHNNKVKKWVNNVSIKDYDSDFDPSFLAKNVLFSKVNEERGATVIFRATGDIIPKLKVYQVNFDCKRSCCKTGKCIERFSNITPETAICFRADLAEGIPRYKLRWYNHYGDYTEWEFAYNGYNGIHYIEGTVYKSTFLSFIRKSIGWQ